MMEPDGARPVGREEARLLPQELPELPDLAFTGPEEGWPPLPRGATDFVAVAAQKIPGSLTQELEGRIRASALRDVRVQALLGERFAHIYTDAIPAGKGRAVDPAAPLDTRVVLYSNTHNVAVEVHMRDFEVQAAERNGSYQPPEGDDEIAEAIALARADGRLGDGVRELAAHAILLPASAEETGMGHRRLWVVFTPQEEPDAEPAARFGALVDLTDQEVLAAGPLPAAG